MFLVLGRMLIRLVLGSPELKAQVIAALREGAKKTETKYDDAAVDTFEHMWDVVIPVVIGNT